MTSRPVLEVPVSARRSLGLLAAVLLIVGCAAPAQQSQASPDIAATPSASVAPTTPEAAGSSATPGAIPSQEPQPTADATPSPPPDLVMQVIVTDLVMRTAPGVGADSEMLATRLSAPQLVYLFEGPVTADGYQWYRAMPFDLKAGSLARPGWVAAGSRDGEAWIAPVQLDCPSPTFEVLASRSNVAGGSIANLVCYRGRSISVEGQNASCGAIDPPPLLSPSAIFPACFLAVPSASGWTQLWMAFGPDVVAPNSAGGVRVEGHYDDPTAATCHYPPPSEHPAGDLPDAAEAVLRCRATFVATSMTPIVAP